MPTTSSLSADSFHVVMWPARPLPLAHSLKRALDVVGASLALLLFAVPMVAIAFCVRRDGGAVLFRHRRVGQHGKNFDCYKFRTMVMDADSVLENYLETNEAAREEWAADHKLKHDPRVTRIGAFLRKTSLDELPQFLNVLKGEMSLVGPRPIVREELAKYGPYVTQYCHAKPGITGLWQVSGRNNMSYEERVALDSQYVRHWSLWRDFCILWLTVPAMLTRNGAY